MMTIERYSHDLPNQTGFVAYDADGQPVVAAKTFSGLLTKLMLLDPCFAWGEPAISEAGQLNLIRATQNHPG